MKRVFLLLLTCCLLIAPAAAAGGSGTAASPYIIQTAAELQSIQNNLGAYYVLGNDIDMSQVTSWESIGTPQAPFHGSLDGKGYTIRNLDSENSLFYWGYGITIKNLNIENFNIVSSTRVAGIITTIVKGGDTSSTISNCVVKSSTFASSVDSKISGLVGMITGDGSTTYNTGILSISNCDVIDCSFKSLNSDRGTYHTAGILGIVSSNSQAIITDCNVIGCYINGDSYGIAGILGQFYSVRECTISNCTVSDTIIIGRYYQTGAIVGFHSGGGTLIIDTVIIKNTIVLGGSGMVMGVTTTAGNGVGTNIDRLSNIQISESTLRGVASDNVGGIIGFIGPLVIETSISNSEITNSVLLGGGITNGIMSSVSTPYTITNCNIENTNIYGSSGYHAISDGTYTNCVASGITNVPNRYLYASGLTATPNGATVSYTLEGQQGSTTVEAAQGTAQSWAWTFGDGQTSTAAEDTTHTYAAPGTYQTSLTLKNYLDSTGIPVRTSDYNILPIPPTVSASTNVLQLGQSVTLNAAGTLFSSIQWQYSTNNGASWIDISGATANNYEWTPEAGSYQVRAHVTAVGTGYTANSEVLSLTVYPPPTITNPNANPQQGPLSQSVVLSADVSDVNGDTTYQWQEFASGSWIDISGATTNPATVQISDRTGTLHQYRLAASGIGGTSYSSTVTYQSVAPPVFTAFDVSPLSGGIPLSVSFSATASDTSGYRWEYSTDGTIWVQIATGSAGSYTFTAEGVYYIRVIATGTGGTTTSAVATITASNLLPEFTQISASPTSGVAPFAVTLSATATNGATFVWERQSGSSWVQIGTGASVTYTIPSGTAVGMVYFRAIATNQYGSVMSSSVSVEVGAAPAAEITTPAPGAVFGSGKLISFAAADAGAGVTYSWDFGDGVSGSGRTVTHSYADEGFYMVTLTTSSQFGSSEDVVRIEIVEATGDIWLAVTDVSSSGVTLQATIEVSPVSSGTLVWFELESMSGTVVYKSPQLLYSGPVSYTASGLPLLAGQTYRATAYSNNYGYSIPVLVTLVDAVQPPHETLGDAWNNGLNREPFNVSALVAAGVGVFGGALGGGAVGAAVSFGVIAMFVLVGLWLRQQDIVVPLTLTLIAGWFVIGNLPGDWQPIAYSLMVVLVVAIFFYLFRKRIE